MAFNIFTWWSGQTVGTWLDTVFSGREVGRDADGNIYYAGKKNSRRWVVYSGSNDSSNVPPEWHLWLHKTRADPPSEVPLPVKAWEKPWRPNPTGTAAAELPSGALAAGGKRAPAAADYRAWSPEATDLHPSPEATDLHPSPESIDLHPSPEAAGRALTSGE